MDEGIEKMKKKLVGREKMKEKAEENFERQEENYAKRVKQMEKEIKDEQTKSDESNN